MRVRPLLFVIPVFAAAEAIAQDPVFAPGPTTLSVDWAALSDPNEDGVERRWRRRRGRFHMGLTRGEFEHETRDSLQLSDTTDARHFRIGMEAVSDRFGGGFRFDGLTTDDDLFEDTGPLFAEAGDAELFMHATVDLGAGPLDLPLRAGFFIRNYELEDITNNLETDWFSVGFRTEIEADFAVYASRRMRFGLYTTAGFAIGSTDVSTDPDTFETDTHMTAFDFGFGMRVRLRRFELGLGYLQRNTSYDESTTGGMLFSEVDTEFRGVHATMGFVW